MVTRLEIYQVTMIVSSPVDCLVESMKSRPSFARHKDRSYLGKLSLRFWLTYLECALGTLDLASLNYLLDGEQKLGPLLSLLEIYKIHYVTVRAIRAIFMPKWEYRSTAGSILG